MKNLFLVILFFGLVIGSQIVFFKENQSSDNQLKFEELMESIIEVKSTNFRGQSNFGSGIIISDDGYIITASHLVNNAATITLVNQGSDFPAKLIGYDQFSDVAVLKSEMNDLRPIRMPNNLDVSIGDKVYALGNPFNLGISVSSGILSATGRNFGNPYLNIFQTDASINRGNSGGALVNQRGEFIGMNISIASISGGSEGVGFALPSDKVISIAQEIIKYGSIKRAWIGDLRFRGISYRDNENQIMPGLLVIGNDKTISGGLEDGDIILKIKGASAIWSTFIASINSIKPGEEIELEVVRKDKLIELKIVTVLKPDD